MSYYEKNMECMKECRNYMYDNMKDLDVSTIPNKLQMISSQNTKDSQQALKVKLDDLEYRLNSTYYPIAEAKKWFEQYKIKNLNNIISMFGFGNGIFVRTVIENMKESDALLIYEPSAQIFLHVMEQYDISDIISHPRVSIAVEDINEFEFHNALRGLMDITNMSDQVFCTHPQYEKMFPENFVNFWKEIKDGYVHVRINMNTERMLGKSFIENALKNIKYLGKSNTVSELKKELPEGIPAIIVAAGPSVSDHIEELKQIKNKAVIIAVDRILDFLLDSGVEPDFVVTLDPIKPVMYFTKRKDVTIPLICFLEANHEILDVHKGKKIFSNCTAFMSPVYKDYGKIPPHTPSSSSVATVAFSACLELGFKKVILVGQDLAYDGKRTHAGGVEEKVSSDKDIVLEGIDGNPVRSRYDWKLFVTWYQDMIIHHPQVEVIDAKVKGAKIKGTTIMPFKEAIDIYCNKEYEKNEYLANMEPTFDSKGVLDIKEYLDRNLDILDIIKYKAETAIKACKLLSKENENNDMESKSAQRSLKKLNKINNYITKQPIYDLMDTYVMATASQHLVQINHITDDTKADNGSTFEKAISIFEATIEASDFIKPKLEETISEL